MLIENMSFQAAVDAVLFSLDLTMSLSHLAETLHALDTDVVLLFSAVVSPIAFFQQYATP